MNWFARIWKTSIGKKFLVALTGLALVIFLFAHIFGNLHLYWGARSFNNYADHLHSMSVLLPVAEWGLLILFVVHIGLVIQLNARNRKNREVGYKVSGTKNPGFKYVTSKFMVISGLVVLTFLVVHILDYRIHRAADDVAFAQCVAGTLSMCQDSLSGRVVGSLTGTANLWRVVLYALGSLFIGWHLFHGIQSAFRSLGVASNKWTPVINKIGAIISILIGVLFASIPIALFAASGSFAQPGVVADAQLAPQNTIQIEALDAQEDLTNTDTAGEVPEGIQDNGNDGEYAKNVAAQPGEQNLDAAEDDADAPAAGNSEDNVGEPAENAADTAGTNPEDPTADNAQ